MRRAGSLLALLLLSGPAAAQDAAPDATVAWIKERAVPLATAVAGSGFKDLQPLRKLIGDARIVSLGESTHGSREIFQMKHRLVEFLATEMGFTIFSIEANLPEAYRLNDYVLGGKGDPDGLITGMYFWTWRTREVKDMVEWMRSFNAGRKGRIEFTGFDMQFPDVAMEEVLRFLKVADEKLHAEAEAAYRGVTPDGALEFGVATGTFPPKYARGRKLQYRGWIKTEDVTGFAGLWWRCDGRKGEVLAFDNMEARKIRGTTDWTQVSLELEIPDETSNINFGVILPGTGTAWFDGLEIYLDGERFEPGDDFDFDFESDKLRGFSASALKTYRTEVDPKTAKTGKQSLRLRCISSAPIPGDGKKILEGCRDVHRRLVAARDELVKKHPAKDADWAIVNARLIVSAVEQRNGNGMIRDAAMAENVAWILDRNPGAKIVLWAHNAHVARRPFMMGKYLDRKYGKSQVTIGFATAKGDYQAVGDGRLGIHQLQAPPADSCEAAFQRTGMPRFFLDLRDAKPDDEASGWLSRSRPFRLIGAVAMDRQFSPAKLPDLFDGVIYIEQTTAAQPLDR